MKASLSGSGIIIECDPFFFYDQMMKAESPGEHTG